MLKNIKVVSIVIFLCYMRGEGLLNPKMFQIPEQLREKLVSRVCMLSSYIGGWSLAPALVLAFSNITSIVWMEVILVGVMLVLAYIFNSGCIICVELYWWVVPCVSAMAAPAPPK